MTKVLFFSKYYLDKDFNLKYKFNNQIKALKNLGYDVWYIGLENKSIYLINDEKKLKLASLYIDFIPKYENTILHIRLYQAVKKAIKNYEFDFVYMRSVFSTPSSISMIKQMKKNKMKVIMEIPTFPIENEHDKESRLLRRIILKLNNKFKIFLYKYVDLFTIIGEDAKGSYYNKPAINIENGFDIKSVPLRKKIYNRKTHMLGLANLAKWHGYDRIIEGLRNYINSNNREKIILHLIGPDGDGSKKKWINLVHDYNLDNHVIFEGPKYGDDLNYYFNKCDLAIGSLGNHRKNMEYLSTLKVREYMARGIPFIISHKDLALDKNADYFLKVPSNDKPIDIKRVIKFLKKIKEKPSLSKEMREYANKNMTWEKQFKKVFDFFNE